MKAFSLFVAISIGCLLIPSAVGAANIHAGIGQASGTAQISAHEGPTEDVPAAVRDVSSGGQGAALSSPCKMVADFGGTAVIVPCSYQPGDAGPFAPVAPGQPAPQAPPDANQIGTAAQDYLKTLQMPTPQPKMSAPQGITGAKHSVDMQIPNKVAFPDGNTPFGPVSATAVGSFTVDWGDGSKDTYSSTGAPWPRSDVEHNWQNTGTYTITVTASWSINWRLGNYSGVLTNLQTTGNVPTWQVVEAQAVITN